VHSPDSRRYEDASAFVYTSNGVASSVVTRIKSASSIHSQSFASRNSPVVTDSDGLATVVIVALRSPPGPRTLQFFCGDSVGNATVSLNIFIKSIVTKIQPLSPSPFSVPQAVGAPFTMQPSFKLCASSSAFGQCIPVPSQVVVAVAESYVTDGSLDGNKMAQLTGFVSAKSDASGVATFTNLAVAGSSSRRVYFSFFAGGNAWTTWDGSPCSPESASRCLSFVQLTGGPLIQKIIVSPVGFGIHKNDDKRPSVVKEGDVFPPIIVQAMSAASAPISNMIVFAQFSRIAGSSAPMFTTPLKFSKQLLRAVAVTNQTGQAVFNLSTSIGGFAGAYDVTFLPSVFSSSPINFNAPVVSVLISTSVVSVYFEGPSMVVRTLVKNQRNVFSNTIDHVFGHLVATSASDMQSVDYSTFFRLYFNLNQAHGTHAAPRYVVTAVDAMSNLVPSKFVEMISDPANVLDLMADTYDYFGHFEPSYMPVTLSSTGSSELFLKLANPIPLALWPRPPVQMYGINTARFYFLIDGVKSSSFVTVFLTPPVPPPPLPPSVVVSNLAVLQHVLSADTLTSSQILLSICDASSILLGASSNASLCPAGNTFSIGEGMFCVHQCPSSLSQLLSLWYQFTLPVFHFVVLPRPSNLLSRTVGRATVDSSDFYLEYGLTTFDGSPVPKFRLARAGPYLERFRSSPIANSRSLKIIDETSTTNGFSSLANNVYVTLASPFTLIPNVTSWRLEHEAVLQCISSATSLCHNVSGNNFPVAPDSFIQSKNYNPDTDQRMSHIHVSDFSYSSGLSGSIFVDIALEVT
jgi:hypothetical protein